MFSRWKKIDIVIAVLFVLTNISYLFIPNKTIFKIFLWTLIIFAAGRLLLLFKRKLLWKIRNRLLFSGLFIVATPIFFILIFFYVMSYILIAHYEVVILNKIMDGRLVHLEQIADRFLNMKDMDKIEKLIDGPLRFDQGKLNVLFYEKKNETFHVLYKHAAEKFPENKLIITDFKGYFLVNNTLHHGVLKQKENVAVLISNTINQETLDEIATMSDFKIKYQHPYSGSSLKMLEEVTDDPEIMDENNSFFPYLFDYTFLDFNNIENSRPAEENARFLLKVDFKKLYSKILTSSPGSVQNDTFRFIILLIVIFAPFVAFSFFIGFRMIRVITRSINQITKGTQKIRNGDFSFRIKTRSKDELQYLGESFNEMAAGIDRLLIEEKEKQRLEEELRIARSIQLRLLPPDSFESDGFEIAAVNIPAAEIAGDYFDYFYKKDKSLSILVADVSGKGAPAAFYMAELKGLINHLHAEEMSPASLICECQESLSDSLDKSTFITMVIARLIIPERKFVLSRAGHTQALYFNANEKVCHELFPEGVAIGLKNFSREKLQELEVKYGEGDILFLFSDGLSEILNKKDEMIGVENLKKIIRQNSSSSAEEIKQQMLDFAIKFSETEINRDDLTFIVLKVKC